MLRKGEIHKLRNHLEYEPEIGQWIIPPFLVKNKEVAFPKINNAKTFVLNELEK